MFQTMTNKLFLVTLWMMISPVQVSGKETVTQYLSGKGFEDAVPWEFYCTAGMNSGTWTTIPVPSCWEQHGFGAYHYGHTPFEERLKEEGHYRMNFRVDRDMKGRQVDLVFEGVMTDALVKINGKQAGEVHQGAFYPFRYDITSLIRFGKENLLEVFVKKFSDNLSVNQAERKADYWIFGGIFRPVYLEIKPAEHIRRVAVDPRADGSLRAEIHTTELQGNRRLEAEITDGEGNRLTLLRKGPMAEGTLHTLSGTVKGIEAWNPEYPRLYSARFLLKDAGGEVIHSHTEKIGFRTVEVREADGVYLNGERIRFKGVNRHTFHPDHGRTSSKALSIEVVNLIKGMNMNAVRMSHYPPDRHFLDACDSLGLLVLDELAGWQAPPYDSAVGRRLLQAMIERDVNHPSVVIWDNGNEGGWNTAYDDAFRDLDIQKREVIHPWGVHRKINTAHYVNYDYLAMDHFAPRKVFFPTEVIHGLYDGGHAAGLADYWLRMWEHPLCGGAFLWVFADEAVKRSDTGILDSDGNHAPDGIVGPYHEKEGSYFAIREIWSPVHIEKRYITPEFNGVLRVQNRFHFTSLDQCSFRYQWVGLPAPSGGPERVLAEGEPLVDSLEPLQNGEIRVPLPGTWREADVLRLEAVDPHGRLIHRWSWPVKPPAGVFREQSSRKENPGETVSVSEHPGEIRLEANGVSVRISKADGLLAGVWSHGREIPLTEGPLFHRQPAKLKTLKHYDFDGSHRVEADFGETGMLLWTLHPNGFLDMDLSYQPETGLRPNRGGTVPYTGASFSYPEEMVRTLRYLGGGPYRVWKNRTAGVTFGVWDKAYNETITGHSGYEYPEFKGYYRDLYWAVFSSQEGESFRVYSRTDDLYLRLFTPDEAPDPARTTVEHPPGDLSFMLGIPPIGTKFRDADRLGPRSGGYPYQPKRVEGGALSIQLTFDFSETP